jgi:hypothetical protein
MTRRYKYHIIKSLSFSLAVVTITILSIPLLSVIQIQTGDDSRMLSTILERVNSSKVLGASTENDDYLYGCHEDKPIVGWVNYEGKKVIRNTLPNGEVASACFKNLPEAQQNGFEIIK